MKFFKYKKWLFILALNLMFVAVHAQVLPQNLANVTIDDLSDQQIQQLIQQGQTAGFTDNQIIQNASSRGLPAAQVQKLQVRMAAIRKSNSLATINSTDAITPRSVNYKIDSVNNLPVKSLKETRVFGADLFRNTNSSFEPNLKLATPVNYILGPEDQLDISVYGNSVVNWKLSVSAEGNINLPSGGLVNVAGKSIAEATELIKNRLIAKNYSIGNGTTLKVSLGNIRSIKVIMAGEVVKPGTYTLPSLATAFNALYSAGGPGDNGSFRQIEIIRNNRIIKRLDVYDFLVKGSQKDNISLQDQDIIRVPTYNIRVEARGEIKSPAIFEVLPGETLNDVIRFAGGYTNEAYRANIKISQISDKQRRITDVVETNFKNYVPLAGDIYTIEKIIDRYENRVTINGSLIRPGEYELQKNMSLLQLINKASGLTEDAFTQRGTISRLNPDNSRQLISFNLVDVLNKSVDITLQREDVVNVQSIFDLHDRYVVKISGEVRKPGEFAYSDSMKVENLVLMAGGFSEGASMMRVEVARRVYDSDPKSSTAATAKVFSMDLGAELKPKRSDFTLKPFDIVLVYSLPGYIKQGLITVIGEATYPGPYAIQHKNEKISDIIRRAGGLTASADADGSTLKRSYAASIVVGKKSADTSLIINERLQKIDRIKQGFNDVSRSQDDVRNNLIGIDLRQIIDKPGSATDLLVKDGDVITIPQQQQIVQVNGEVHVPSGVVYLPGKSFKEYIINAGGYSNDALKRGSYIIYPNGTVKGTRKFLFFNNYPTIKPGSEIFIPQRPLRRGINFAELAGIISALGTTVVLAILTLKK